MCESHCPLLVPTGAPCIIGGSGVRLRLLLVVLMVRLFLRGKAASISCVWQILNYRSTVRKRVEWKMLGTREACPKCGMLLSFSCRGFSKAQSKGFTPGSVIRPHPKCDCF